MCGIAGIIDLMGSRPVPTGAIRRMTDALIHRGPDEEGFFERPGVALGSRRLSIVGLADGQQPVTNEDGSVSVVFNGELFDHVEQREILAKRGHVLRKHCDTEIIPHLWEEHGEEMFAGLRGQFAIALWDEKKRELLLTRDRFGICPLYWTQQGGWLLFASEIKGLLASRMVEVQPDLQGLDQVFTFAALPGPLTCFQGVNLLTPGHFLRVSPAGAAPPQERAYWRMDFPNRGEEDPGADEKKVIGGLEEVLLQAVEKRLRADVPVGSYLSGGIDSSIIVALACHLRGEPISTYTVQVDEPELDELSAASLVARYVKAKPPLVQEFAAKDVLATYPQLIQAAEAPVIDTSCAALLLLARRVRESANKVVLTGEGSDEWLLGYPWYKAHKALGLLNAIPGLNLSGLVRRGFLRWNQMPVAPPDEVRHRMDAIGGPSAWLDAYGFVSISKLQFYSERMLAVRAESDPWRGLGMDLQRAAHWHSANREIWLAARVNMAGHLLQAKGDRVAMHSSVEVRYPFLDEDVFTYLARLHPRWKLRGFQDKYILRRMAERWLPKSVYARKKVIFRAPFDSFHMDPEPGFVAELLSEESLGRTGYFNVQKVRHWRQAFRKLRPGSLRRLTVEMGLTAVVATQLWHHTYIDGSLAALPSQAA